MKVNAPMRFEGTAEEAAANFRSHHFVDGRCWNCDCRPFGRIASWPCGVEPPRVEDETAATELGLGFALYAAAGGVA